MTESACGASAPLWIGSDTHCAVSGAPLDRSRVPRSRPARVAPGIVLLATWLAFARLALPLPGTADAAQGFRGKVVAVTDGDTITVLHDGRSEAVRLNGIDAPEKGQAFGERAKQFTASLAFGKVVSVRAKDLDRYGRTIADVILSDGRGLNQEVVRAGYAWWFRRYSADYRLANLEAEARAARVGLWADR